MSAPINVRATIEDWWVRKDLPEDLYLAQLAFRELVEATHEFRACIGVMVILTNEEAPADLFEAASQRYEKANARLEAALANAGCPA